MSQSIDPNRGLSRRTMVKGAAWSVPVVATAVAVPFASASTVDKTDLGISFVGASFDLRNNLVNGLDNWYNGLSVVQKGLAAIPYAALKAAVQGTTAIANIGFEYPSNLRVSNIGNTVLDAAETAQVQMSYTGDILNVAAINAQDPTVSLTALQTGGGAVATVTPSSDVQPTGTVADVPLRYNPVTIEVNLLGGDQVPSTISGLLTGDADSNGNSAQTPYGLRLDVLGPLGGLVSALLTALGLGELKIPITLFS